MKLAGEAKMREEPVVRRTFPKKPSGSVVISASPFRGEHTHKAHAKVGYLTLIFRLLKTSLKFVNLSNQIHMKRQLCIERKFYEKKVFVLNFDQYIVRTF